MSELVVKSATSHDSTFSGQGGTVWDAGMAPSSGQLSAGYGGTGVDGSAAGNGKLLIGNGSGYTLANLTQGSNVTITNSAGGISIASTAAGSDVIFAGAPNTDFDLTNGGAGGAVTILSKSITGISAGDQIILQISFTVLNNSGSLRAITPICSLGSLSVDPSNTTFNAGASATSRSGYPPVPVGFFISATNLAYGTANTSGQFGALAAGSTWNSTTSDLTGTQTLTFTLTSNSTTATQTATLHGYTIRKIATI